MYSPCTFVLNFKSGGEGIINIHLVEKKREETSNSKQRHIGIVEKEQETSPNTGMYIILCAYAVLNEQWMNLGMQTHTHTTGNNLIPISFPSDSLPCSSIRPIS